MASEPGVARAPDGSSLDPEQPVYNIQTLEEVLATSSFQQRLSAVLISIFAGVALVLAAIGIYGVMSYAVSARTQEMGVRLAVGAQRRDVIWLVLGQVLRLSAIGLSIGILVLVLAGLVLEGLLFGVRSIDPVTIAAVAVMHCGARRGVGARIAREQGRSDPSATD